MPNMPVADVNLNALWCRCIAEELVRSGVQFVVLCPGSRNSPLIFALTAQPGLTCLGHVDERSAGFIALGLARANDHRVAVCVTSGSAVANLLPALAEAHAAELPLIVISADRPWEAQDCGAPQAMPQRGIFASFAAALDLGEPLATANALCSLRARVSRIIQTDHAPVHINVPLRDPLPPLPDPAWSTPPLPEDALRGRSDSEPFTTCCRATTAPDLPSYPWLKPGLKGLIVAGSTGRRHPDVSVMELARATGWPLLADVASGLRRSGLPELITSADALCLGPLAAERPELIVQIGPVPLSRSLYEWLGKQDCPWISVESQTDQDWLHRAWVSVQGQPGAALTAIATRCAPGNIWWKERWLSAERQARARLDTALLSEPWNELSAVHRALNHPGFRFLHCASSMAIRLANLLAQVQDRPVFANRGLNGIDGTLGTFLGECLAQPGEPGLLMTGDLAMLHDLPALAAVSQAPSCGPRPVLAPRGALVVLNNHGGAIFDHLPVSQVPGYERWIRANHDLDFAHIAAQFSCGYRKVTDVATLDAALDDASEADRKTLLLIECLLPAGGVERFRGMQKRLTD